MGQEKINDNEPARIQSIPTFVKVAKVSDLKSGISMSVQVCGQEIALHHINQNFCATANTCPHRGGPLGEGTLDGIVVTCPWHGWQFNVCRGSCLTNPEVKIATYPVKVDGDDVLVEI